MLNKVILIGHVGQDPEIKSTASGDSLAVFSLATSERWKDKSTGERKEKTEWHRVVVFSEGLVKVVQDYVEKGSKLYIEGQLTTRKWTEGDGTDRYATEINIKSRGKIVLLDSAGGGSRNTPPDSSYDEG